MDQIWVQFNKESLKPISLDAFLEIVPLGTISSIAFDLEK